MDPKAFEAEHARLARFNERQLANAFDAALDTVTERALDEFDFLGLPEGDELAAITIEVNDALSAIFSEWK